jgi:hypothetical protein
MVALVIFALAQEWTVFIFTLIMSVFGGLIYWKKDWLLKKLPTGFVWFILIAAVISILEESLCFTLGCNMADPNLLIDLYIVVPIWAVWFSSWWLMAKRYKFTQIEALMIAGFNGFLYEYVGTGAVLQDPIGWIIAYPLVSIVYSSIFILPMLMIKFTGERRNVTAFFIAAFLPFALSIPTVVVLGIIRALIGF